MPNVKEKKENIIQRNWNKFFSKKMDSVNSLIDDLSVSIYGANSIDESDVLNDRFNKIMSAELKGITGNNKNDYTTFLGQVYSDDRDNTSILREIGTKIDLGGRDSIIQASQFVTDAYRNKIIRMADAKRLSEQLIELNEAKCVMRDAIISADINTGRINREILFEKSTVNDISEDYTPIIERMEKTLDIPKKLKDFIVDNLLVYGEYYVYTIPYHELYKDFASRYRGIHRDVGFKYYESVDESVENIRVMYLTEGGKEDKLFIEEASSYIVEEMGYDERKDQGQIEKITDDITTLLTSDRITVSETPVPIPILEDGIEAYHDFVDEYIAEDGSFMEDGKNGSNLNKNTDTDVYLRKYGTNMYPGNGEDGFHQEKGKTEDFDDLKDCYIKMIDPTHIIPVGMAGHTLFYLYIQTEDATPLSSILSYESRVQMRDPTNKINNLVEDIATRVVNKFSKSFVRQNKEFRKLIVAALEYYDLGTTKIHFQVIPKEYITEFKINVDEKGEGHSMLEKSFFYGKLYLMLFMFYIVTIITKSNDQEINYIRTSGIDKNVYNKAQQIARQKQARKITINDMFSYTGVINKIGSGSAIYMPLGKNNEKPIETEILSGQNVDMNNEFMDRMRTNYILSTGVPSAILNYLNEADYAKSIETANNNMHGRVINYQIDINGSTTEMYKKCMKFSTNIPDEVISSCIVKFPEPKGTANITTQELINNYTTLQEFLIKLKFGDSPDDDAWVKRFTEGIAKLHLPMLNFAKIDEIYETTRVAAVGANINGNEPDLDIDAPGSSVGGGF